MVDKMTLMTRKPWIVAEISGEHCGDFSKCKDLISEAKGAGADAIKLQCFDPVKLAVRRGGGRCTVSPWVGMELLDLYQKTCTPRAWFPDLFALGRALGITVFSSVFDPEDVDFLETLDCPAYKISSYESKDDALIDKAASTGKTLIISGPWKPSPKNARFLYCVSEYPTPLDRVYLSRMVEQDCDGFSDHTIGTLAAVVAAALGASIIEKHITLSRSKGGPDASFALEPWEFRVMVDRARDARLAVGG